MFRVGNVNEYSGLAIPMPIQNTIQPSTIVGGSNVSVANSGIDDNNGREDLDESISPKCDASSNFYA